MFPPLVSPANLAILQKAIDTALGLAARRNVVLTVNELAAQLSSAFEAGERDPVKLAEAVFAAARDGAALAPPATRQPYGWTKPHCRVPAAPSARGCRPGAK